jgi:cytochrome P450
MPLPPTLPLPTAIQTLLWMRRPTALLEFCQRRFGDLFTLKVPVGNLVLVSDPACIKQVFTGDPDLFRAGEVNLILEPILGENSVLTLDGKAHLRQRKLMLPPFHGERMRLYAATMQRITEESIAGWPENRVFALHGHAQQITLEVILRTVFGVDERARVEALRVALNRLLGMAGSTRAAFLLVPALRRDLGPLTPYRRFRDNIAAADELIYTQIRHRRAQVAGSGARRDDVLSLLLEARDEEGQPLGEGELRDELMTLLIAGHETTATALCWAFDCVLGVPRVLAQLRAELDAVLAGEPLKAEHLPRLEYLDATITEVLRLRPVVPVVGRKLRAPFRLADYILPPGTVVAPSIYLTHRRPDVYPSPTEFRPERFVGTRPDPYAWIPFGGGIRRCLGMAFALYELKIMMATILSTVDLERAETAPQRVVRRAITFAPEHGTRVRARRRDQAAGRAGEFRIGSQPAG